MSDRVSAAQAHHDLLAAHGWKLAADHPDLDRSQALAIIADGPDPVAFHARFLRWRAVRPSSGPAPRTQAEMTARITGDWLIFVRFDADHISH